jgi:type I restriction enzyme S subunit
MATLGELCVEAVETRDPRRNPEAPFRYVDISSVDNRRKVITEARQLPGKQAPSRARQVIRPGDVLVATTRPNLNAVALVPKGLYNEICSTGFCVLRSNGEVDPEFLFAFVQTREFVRPLSDLVKGALYPAVTDGQVRAQKLTLPPLPEQRRIAARLREQLAAVAEARAAVQAQLDAAQCLGAAHLRAVFDTNAAQQWPMRNIGALAAIAGGIQKTPDRAPRNYHKQFLTVRNVQRGYLDLSQVERFEITPAEFERCRLQRGDILVVEGNGSRDHIGRNALFDQDGEWIHQNHIIRARVSRDVLMPEFVSLFLNSEAGRKQMLEKAKTTTGLYTLSTSKIASLEIPVPNLAEQQTAVHRLQTEHTASTTLCDAFRDRLSALDHLPAALLREAFAGRI